jgi:hypothetical protein
MAETAKDPPRQRQRNPHIGAFVLETLTVGMYGEPRHTLREYVQNSFDSIRSAQRTKYLAGRGRVDINIAVVSTSISRPTRSQFATMASACQLTRRGTH